MADTRTDLGTEKIGRLLVRLAIPTITAQIVNMLYNIVDRIYIGHIPGEGALALTGLGLCFPVLMLITAFSSLFLRFPLHPGSQGRACRRLRRCRRR